MLKVAGDRAPAEHARCSPLLPDNLAGLVRARSRGRGDYGRTCSVCRVSVWATWSWRVVGPQDVLPPRARATTRRRASRAVPKNGHAESIACLDREKMMGIGDFLGWILVGLLAGGLASALTPGRTPGGLLGVIGIGVLGALLGGWGWALLFGSGPTTFLGSVIVGVLGAMAILYLLRRLERTRYRI